MAVFCSARLHPRVARQASCQTGNAQVPGARLTDQDQRGGAVVQRRGVGCGDGAIFLEIDGAIDEVPETSSMGLVRLPPLTSTPGLISKYASPV